MTQQTFDSKKLVIASMESEDLGRKTPGEPWRVLEFYSGIGGMRYSLMKAAVNAVVVEAFDINDLANDVYEHNFGHRPYQGNIQTLSPADLDSYKADVWLLSPPCQPYTRQGLQKGSADARASSFLKILELVPQTLRPPRMLFVENVVGFEASDTHQRMVSMLQENDFILQEFILSPLHFGVPYSRPRYFCLAKSKLLSFHNPKFNNGLVRGPGPLCGNDDIVSREPEGDSDRLLQDCQPVADFLEFNDSVDKTHPDSNPGAAKIAQLSEKADDEMKDVHHSSMNQYFVPSSLVERWGNAMDIVFPDSKRCCCFTKSYYRFVKGTGSLLATDQYEEGMQKNDVLSIEELHLRYFTPREVANLHSFPSDFQFPHHVSLRQRYALLGNSLSIAVVAPLLSYLFTTTTTTTHLPCNHNP